MHKIDGYNHLLQLRLIGSLYWQTYLRPLFESFERNRSHVDFIVNKQITRLTDARTEKLMSCYSNLQMLRTLTNRTNDKAFNCWSNVDGEESPNDEAEEASGIKDSSIQDTYKSTLSWMVTDVCYLFTIVVPVIALWVITAPALGALWNSMPTRQSTHRRTRCAWLRWHVVRRSQSLDSRTPIDTRFSNPGDWIMRGPTVFIFLKRHCPDTLLLHSTRGS